MKYKTGTKVVVMFDDAINSNGKLVGKIGKVLKLLQSEYGVCYTVKLEDGTRTIFSEYELKKLG